jgi:hypothetical protein
MRSISDDGKAAPDVIIEGRRFVFWGNLALTLFFFILTACIYNRRDAVAYLGVFFTVLYAVCTLLVGFEILKSRARFFAKTRNFP